jgi:hypothetical protein
METKFKRKNKTAKWRNEQRTYSLLLSMIGLLLVPSAAYAQAQPQTKERALPPVKKIQPAATTNVLPKTIIVVNSDVAALAAKVEEFRKGLSPGESGVFSRLLLRAIGAPADNPAGINVSKRFFTAGLIEEGAIKTPESNKGIIVQGGREQSQNEIAESPIAILREALGTGNVSIGPKQEDPTVSGRDAVSIGLKQGDPRSPMSTLAGKMLSFSNNLSVTEKAMMDLLLQRASSSANTSEAQDGLRPSPVEVLRGALGIKSIGPKQEDPARNPPTTDRRWILRF